MFGNRSAVILIGHGSLRSQAGIDMLRVAGDLAALGIAPSVEAAFLNYGRPTLAEVVATCAARGVTHIAIQPYFLISGKYVLDDLAAQIAAVALRHPHLTFSLAGALDLHPALIDLAARRVQAAALTQAGDNHRRGLLLMAHGTPVASANAPLYPLLLDVCVATHCAQGLVGYLDCNQPDILTAAIQLVTGGATEIIALPYFLHRGRHVRDDLPVLIAQAQAAHPQTAFILADHLGYDPGLAHVVMDRLAAVQPVPVAQPVGVAVAEQNP